MKRLPYVCCSLAGALGCALLSPSSASGEIPGSLKLTWDTPADCPSAQQVQGEISRLLHGDVKIRQGGDLDVRITTVRNGETWTADLMTLHAGQAGRRLIEAPSCPSVADAAALIVALMIDPDAVADVSQRRNEMHHPPPPKAERESMEFLVGPNVQGRLGTLPGVDIGLGAGVGLSGRRWQTDVRWTYGLKEQVATLPSGASGRFGIVTGSVSGCLNLGHERAAFGPCAVLEAGLVSSSGFGASAGFSKHAAWLAVGGGFYLASSLGRYLRPLLEFDVLLPMHRPDYVFQDLPGVVFRAPAVGSRALAAIACNF